MAALLRLSGVGDWTAQYVALRAFGEPDAFPAADLVLRQMAASNGVPVTPRDLARRAEAWRPWRAYATMHLWRAAGASRPSRTRTAAGVFNRTGLRR
jgi:AraC family transcriptional regulator of adaptative response / DNA-3-methyladenine glycosylase II